MAMPPTEAYLRSARVNLGDHDICYRCDAFEKNHDGTCELCGLTDRIDRCVREWCPYCKVPELSDFYLARCTERAPHNSKDVISAPIVGPLAHGYDTSNAFRIDGTLCTYAILCGQHVKVGKSRSVRKRLAQLQTGMPLPAFIMGSVLGDCEKEVHRKLEDRGVKRTNGEWFEYDNEARKVLAAFRLITPAEWG